VHLFITAQDSLDNQLNQDTPQSIDTLQTHPYIPHIAHILIAMDKRFL